MSSEASGTSAPAEDGDLRSAVLRGLAGRGSTLATVAPLTTPGPVTVAVPSTDPMAAYRQLQRRIVLITALLSLVAVVVAALRFSTDVSLSVAIGTGAGLFYLRLLSRGVERLGPDQRQVGKVQLLIPAALVLLSTRWSLLQLVPALIGFLVYKPAVIIATVLDLRSAPAPQAGP
ncbi:MAG: ATP synthase subunit I [Cyanobacteriota bacterium]